MRSRYRHCSEEISGNMPTATSGSEMVSWCVRVNAVRVTLRCEILCTLDKALRLCRSVGTSCSFYRTRPSLSTKQ